MLPGVPCSGGSRCFGLDGGSRDGESGGLGIYLGGGMGRVQQHRWGAGRGESR